MIVMTLFQIPCTSPLIDRVGQNKVYAFGGLWNKNYVTDIQTLSVDLIYQSKANLDCVHTMPAHFENGEKFDG